MSERVMSGKLASLPSEVEPLTWFAALPLSPYNLLFQSIRNLCHNPCHNRCAIGLGLQRDVLEETGCEIIYQDEGIIGIAIERDGLTQVLSAIGAGDTPAASCGGSH